MLYCSGLKPVHRYTGRGLDTQLIERKSFYRSLLEIFMSGSTATVYGQLKKDKSTADF